MVKVDISKALRRVSIFCPRKEFDSSEKSQACKNFPMAYWNSLAGQPSTFCLYPSTYTPTYLNVGFTRRFLLDPRCFPCCGTILAPSTAYFPLSTRKHSWKWWSGSIPSKNVLMSEDGPVSTLCWPSALDIGMIVAHELKRIQKELGFIGKMRPPYIQSCPCGLMISLAFRPCLLW